MAIPVPMLFDIEIHRCSGEGKGFCVSCASSGYSNCHWLCSLSYITIDHKRIPGFFCSKCALIRASELGTLLNGGGSDG